MRRLLLVAALAALVAGCDFTPTLDIELPAFEPALALNGVLAADSTVEVRVTVALDPYAAESDYRRRGRFESPSGLTAELSRNGEPPVALRLETTACPTGVVLSGEVQTRPCDRLVSDVAVEAGATYTVRASAPGFPPIEATVTVPERVPATVTARPPTVDGSRTDTDLTVTFRDPAGLGHRYALLVVSGPYSYPDRGYCEYGGCPDSTVRVYRDREPLGYTTTDPVLLAGARTVPSSGTDFVTFTDEQFDGTERAFRLRSQVYDYGTGIEREPAGVWVASLDGRTFGAYQLAWFGNLTGDGSNPFSEPADLPSNVVGGYGLLGAVTVTEALLE